MSENQTAPQAPAATQTPQDTAPAQQQGHGSQGSAGGQTGTGSIAEAAKEAARKLRYKGDDGSDVEVDEDEVIKTYKERKKHQAVASRELNEGRAAKKQAEEFVAMMKDPKKYFETAAKLGHDPRKLAEEFLAEKIKYEMMDPKDRELLEKDQRLKDYEAREAAEREAREAAQHAKLKEHYVKKFNTEITEALQSTPIPQTKESVARMADYIAKAAKAKIPMSAKEAALLVQQDLSEVSSRIYRSASPEQLLELLGEETLQKLRAHDIAKLKNPAQPTPPEQGELGQRKKRDSNGRYTSKEWNLHKRGLL